MSGETVGGAGWERGLVALHYSWKKTNNKTNNMGTLFTIYEV